ncbi:hypothetical protein NPX13_g4195 [Xylaria arbuscula]|uniref:F-box domain-containing protein n=1 Tax=Xylaria arbuscula TaxID=114810 RepID=A0A9W8TNW0_9PEZI|nr:hypothetical protein NPX13_g4195 [Xylaria arbuscula]
MPRKWQKNNKKKKERKKNKNKRESLGLPPKPCHRPQLRTLPSRQPLGSNYDHLLHIDLWVEDRRTKDQRAKKPFRLLDLPSELRLQILSRALPARTLRARARRPEVLAIFLTCRIIYQEAADVFYHETRVNLLLRRGPPGILTEPLNPSSPRLQIRTLNLKIRLMDNIRDFFKTCVPAMREMAEKGKLHTLRLLIAGDWPVIETRADTLVHLSPVLEEVREARAFTVALHFQNFLEFLSNPHIPKVELFVKAHNWFNFWCRFRRHRPRGAPCPRRRWPSPFIDFEVDQQHLLHCWRRARHVQANSATRSLRITPTRQDSTHQVLLSIMQSLEASYALLMQALENVPSQQSDSGSYSQVM